MAKDDDNSKSSTDGEFSNPDHPYYIHQSDHPGMVLVGKPLSGDNYSTWSRQFRLALSAKNKIGFLDGSIKKPLKAKPEYDRWRRCNDMVLSWILNSLEPDLANSVIYTDSAHEIWADLEERFAQTNAPRRPSSSNIGPSFQPRGNPREPKQCTYCNGKTHTIDTCFFLKGFPPGHKWHGKEVVPKLDDNSRPSQNNSPHGSNRQHTIVHNVQSPDAQIHHLQT
ncbi:unnamed protein product, partial [Prunus brigantina]